MEAAEQQQPTMSSSNPPPARTSWRRRAACWAIRGIQVWLALELAAQLLDPFLPEANSASEPSGSEGEEVAADPTDVLMAYLTGRTGLAPVMALSDRQLRRSVDNLVTEDFEELGVKDRGREIQAIVNDIVAARNGQPLSFAPEELRPQQQQSRQERVGLGRLRPFRGGNGSKKAKQPARSTPSSSRSSGSRAEAGTAVAEGEQQAEAGEAASEAGASKS